MTIGRRWKELYIWPTLHFSYSKNPLQPHLFRLGTEVSRTAKMCGPLRTQSPPVWRRCGSCCSWGWWWPRSWGNAVAWGRTHSGTPSCARGWSPGHQWVSLLLYPYIGHSPFSTLCGWREKERETKLDHRLTSRLHWGNSDSIFHYFRLSSESYTKPCEKSFN